MSFSPVDEAVVRQFTMIDRDVLRDLWDRFVVGTALAFELPLVTADRHIQKSGLVEATWSPDDQGQGSPPNPGQGVTGRALAIVRTSSADAGNVVAPRRM